MLGKQTRDASGQGSRGNPGLPPRVPTSQEEHPPSGTLTEYVNGCLDEHESTQIEEHLATCRRCVESLADCSSTLDSFVERLVRVDSERQPDRYTPRREAIGSSFDAGSADVGELPRHIGRFQVRGVLGQGGFGVVLRAFDPRLRREIALKIPRNTRSLSAAMRQRFLHEAQVAATLEHPNVVAVYETGEAAGILFIAGAICNGPNLATLLKEAQDRIPIRVAAQIVAQISSAIATAHQRGILHRDLKPSNIMMDRSHAASSEPSDDEREGPNECRWIPKVTDFGLAKLGPSAMSAVTATGTIVGTVPYMSPEQARGQHKRVGPASDLYSLGAILYELITDRPPFVGESDIDILRRVQTDDPIAPSKLRPGVPKDLETICLKCLSKEQRHRYASAVALEADLQRFIRGEPIAARPSGPIERCWRWCRRHPVSATLSATIASFMSLMVVAALVFAAQTTRHQRATLAQLEQTRQARMESDRAKTETQRQLFTSLISEARARRFSGLQGRRFEGEALLRKAAHLMPVLGQLSQTDRLSLRNEWIATRAQLDVRIDRTWPGYAAGSVDNGVAFDATMSRYAKVDDEGDIVIHSMTDNVELARIDLDTPLEFSLHLRLSPGGVYLAASAAGRLRHDPPLPMRVWEVDTGKTILSRSALDHERDTAFDFSRDGEWFACGDPMGEVAVYKLDSRELATTFTTEHIPQNIRFSNDAKRLAVGVNTQVQVHDRRSGKLMVAMSHPTVSCVAWSRDDRKLVSGGTDKQARVWNTRTGALLAEFEGHRESVNHVDFSADTNYAVSTGFNQSMIWEVATGRNVTQFVDGNATSFSDDGDWLGLGFSGDRIGRFETAWPYGCTLLGDQVQPHSRYLEFSPDSNFLVAGNSGYLQLFETANGRSIGQLTLPQGATFVGARFDHRRSVMLTLSGKGIHAWPIRRVVCDAPASPGDVAAGRTASKQVTECFCYRIGPPKAIRKPDDLGHLRELFLQQDRMLISDGLRTAVFGADRQHTVEPVVVRSPGWWMSLSACGRWLVTSGWQAKHAEVWDLRDGRLVTRLAGYSARSHFSPDGRWLITASTGGYTLYHTDSWQERHSFRWSGPAIPPPIQFSHHGRLLAMSANQSVSLVDIESLTEVAALTPTANESVIDLRFSPDDGRLVAKTITGAVYVWDLRAIRKQLRAIDLDWKTPPLDAPAVSFPHAIHVEFDTGDVPGFVWSADH